MRLVYFALMLISIQSAEIIRAGKDYAILFAVDQYNGAGGFNSLKNPVKDAAAISKELKEMYGFEVKMYENLTKDSISSILEDWQRKSFQPEDQLFIFFSGHGIFRKSNYKGYFIPYLPNATSIEYSTYFDLTDIFGYVTGIPCDHTLLAIDACYAGTIDQKIAFRADSSQWKRPGSSPKNQIISNQLRNKSRLLLTSVKKELAPDGMDHSPFSNAILKKLREAYTSGDGLVTFDDLLGVLSRILPEPHHGVLPYHEGGGFVFVKNNPPAPIKDVENIPITPLVPNDDNQKYNCFTVASLVHSTAPTLGKYLDIALRSTLFRVTDKEIGKGCKLQFQFNRNGQVYIKENISGQNAGSFTVFVPLVLVDGRVDWMEKVAFATVKHHEDLDNTQLTLNYTVSFSYDTQGLKTKISENFNWDNKPYYNTFGVTVSVTDIAESQIRFLINQANQEWSTEMNPFFQHFAKQNCKWLPASQGVLKSLTSLQLPEQQKGTTQGYLRQFVIAELRQ
jgi:Caspase domain